VDLLPCVEIETAGTAEAAVIWLHGLGANGHDFEPIVPELKLPPDLAVRFVFPHAPSMPVTINGGMVMPAWYDILSLDIDRHVNTDQIRQSAARVTALLEREIERGVPAERIVVAGFSQGGAVAFETALPFPRRLAGLLVLSTYLVTGDTVQRHPCNQDLPVFAGHGLFDPVVPEVLGRRTAQMLEDWGHPVDYHTYPMQHQVCLEQVADIGRWLAIRLQDDGA